MSFIYTENVASWGFEIAIEKKMAPSWTRSLLQPEDEICDCKLEPRLIGFECSADLRAPLWRWCMVVCLYASS